VPPAIEPVDDWERAAAVAAWATRKFGSLVTVKFNVCGGLKVDGYGVVEPFR